MNLSFANPAAVWLLLGLAVPVFIHLMHRTRGRKVPFAAVRFVPGAESQRLRSIALSEPLLLLVRCALLITLVLWLAHPQLAVGIAGDKALVLISPRALALADSETLRAAQVFAAEKGATLRVLKAGWPLIDRYRDGLSQPAWSLLSALAGDLPTEAPVWVLTSDDSFDQTWRWPGFADNIYFRHISVDGINRPLRVAIDAAENRGDDKVYLNAGLRAVATQKSLQLVEVDGGWDVLFSLGQGRVPPLAPGQLLVVDATGSLPGRIVFADRTFDVKLHASASADSGEPLLATTDGREVASMARSDAGVRIDWRTRFHPDFTAIVGSHYFPALLRDLVFDFAPQPVDEIPAVEKSQQRHWWLPMLVLLMWLTERWLAGRSLTKRNG